MIGTLITGTGRCGTAYVAELLTRAGMDCGHERAVRPGVVTDSGLPAESSWCAALMMDECRAERVVHLVRDPLAVVRSFVGIGFFTDESTPHRRWARRHFPVTGDPVADAMRWWVTLNRNVQPYATMRLRIEDFPDAARHILGHCACGVAPPTTLNHRDRAPLDALPDNEWTGPVLDMAARYGYPGVPVAAGV